VRDIFKKSKREKNRKKLGGGGLKKTIKRRNWGDGWGKYQHKGLTRKKSEGEERQRDTRSKKGKKKEFGGNNEGKKKKPIGFVRQKRNNI